jgi:ubiquinone/menaquinone biosynthesis C-methylase UbiE
MTNDAPATGTLLAGHYFLAVTGFALMRWWLDEPARVPDLVQTITGVANGMDDFPNSLSIPVTRHDVAAGYTRWAPRYDGPNPAIELEEPVVDALLDGAPRGAALDAACGTGRHAALLDQRGYRVLGVDATTAMLDVARAKVPAADFRLGRLEALPLDGESVDLITCGLALTHVEDLGPVMAEFARVLRPGGHAIISDMHPFVTCFGGGAAFPTDDPGLTINYVPNLVHHAGDYIAAFSAASLSVLDCVEPRITPEMLPRFPSYQAIPDATAAAFTDLPFVLIWRVEKRVS